MPDPITRYLADKGGCLLLDGGLATELEARGQNISNPLWSASVLLSNPRAIVDAHRAFLDAGAGCIASASYQASRAGLEKAGYSAQEAERIILGSIALAQQAVDEYLRDNPKLSRRPLVAASAGPYGAAMQHDGSEYTGVYHATREDLRVFHRERLQLLDRGGADIIALETIPNRMEADVLAPLLRELMTPSWISFCCRDDERISDGTPLDEVVALFADHPGVVAIGVNCTSPAHVVSLIATIRKVAPAKLVAVYPNSGETFDATTKTWHGTVTPLECASAALAWRQAGAVLIGGCCRVSPEHIAAMAKVLGA